MNVPLNELRRGSTLVELMTGVGCGSILLAALLAAGVSLQRSFAAVEGYSVSEGDELRVQDYIAMDCRRAQAVLIDTGSWTSSGGTWSWVSDVNGVQTLILTVPSYYDSSGNAVSPFYDSNGKIQYGAGGTASTTKISYYKSGSNFMRQVGTNPSATKVIASNVGSFNVMPLNLSSTNGTVSCSITFSPTFTTLPGADAKSGTAVHTETFLRNAQARQ